MVASQPQRGGSDLSQAGSLPAAPGAPTSEGLLQQMPDEVACGCTEAPPPVCAGVSSFDDFLMNLQHSGLTPQDLKKAGRAEATEVLIQLGFPPVQRQRALKDLGL